MAPRTDIEYIRFYTDGSAAKQLQAAPKEASPIPAVRPKKKKRYVLRIYPMETVAVLTAIVMFVMILVGTVSCFVQMQENRQLQAYVAELKTENQLLSDTYRQGYDLDQIAEMAHAIGMVEQTQVEQISIQVNVAPEQMPLDPWNQMVTFLTGLFA